MTLPANGVTFVRTTGVGVVAGEFRLEVREDFPNTTTVMAKYLSLQDIIDLEGQLTMLRMSAELGDKFDEPKSEAPISLNKWVKAHIGELSEQGTFVPPTPVTTVFPESSEWVTVDEIGNFVDQIADNKRRHPEIVARRALEEMVELCLAAGASTATILNGVADAIHNQCLKIKERTVFPSQLRTPFNRDDVTDELADVRLVLLDLMHVSSVSEKAVSAQMKTKLKKLKSNPVQNFVTDGHTFYLKKSHIVDAPST